MKVRAVSKIPVRGRRISPQAVPDYDQFENPVSRPAIDLWLAARILGGMHPKAVVVASGNAISLRTAYRWKRALLALEEVQIGDYRAVYAIRRGQGPARLSMWERAA